MTEEDKSRIQEIIELASEIDLWDIELPPIPKSRGNKDAINPFEISGVMRDFVEIQSEIENIERKTTYEQVIEFLETHDGQLMNGSFSKNGKKLIREEMTEEQKEEINLYQRWNKSKERRILEEYTGKPIEEVPEQYREKIAELRSYGLGEEEKTTYEEVIEFLETHEGQLMCGCFVIDGKQISRREMTEEQRKEVRLYSKWNKSKERKILEEYAGKPIKEVPEEYREKIAKLREFGLGTKESKLKQAKQQRDEAKEKNKKAKELEHQVKSQLKKRGQTQDEQ